MCGRYEAPDTALNRRVQEMLFEARRRQMALTGKESIASGEVTPGCVAAALAMGKSGQGAYPMLWGFSSPFGKGLVINVRSETALKKEMFRDSVLHRRCLIPGACYYEWQRVDEGTEKRKIKYAIRPKDEPCMYLAAIYRYEEEQRLPVFSILTREAAPEIAFIHPRMPLIVPERLRDGWLDRDGDPEKLLALRQPALLCRAV